MAFSELDLCKVYASGLVIRYRMHEAGRTPDELKLITKKERVYTIKKSLVQSACIELFLRKKYKVMFITYTFAYSIDEHEASNVWNNFLKSLKKTYHANNYVWVKERQKTGRIHYHILVDIPYFNIQDMQNSFNRSVKNVNPRAVVSSNSVRLGNNPFVYEVKACARYLSKYFSKSDNMASDAQSKPFTTKCYGFTRDLKECYVTVPANELYYLNETYGVKLLFNDVYFDVFYLVGSDVFIENYSKYKLANHKKYYICKRGNKRTLEVL